MNPEEDNKKALWRQEKYLEFRTDLQQNEKLKKFLENVYPTSHERFISQYARDKVTWIEWGEKKIQWVEEEDMQWIDDATERLGEIQQKKLFDAQCLWRAEKLEIPEVRVSHDFSYWERNIFNCPFITAVTEEEVNLYLQYLRSNNFEKQQGWLDDWQDYNGIKEAYNDGENRNFPDWYDFHNGRTGLAVYMMLPDVRGTKEEFYLDLWREEFHHQRKEKQEEAEAFKQITEVAGIAPSEVHDTRPLFDMYEKGQLTWFVNTFEDKETQEVFQQYGGEHIYRATDESLDDDLQMLALSEAPVPVEAWYDWREAIHKAAEKFMIEKIIEALPLAYEQYRMNADLKIPYQDNKEWKDVPNLFANYILRGRELNGEPRDFNF